MARKSRQSFLKRQREARRAERAALKRQKRMERKQKDSEDEPSEMLGGREYLALPEDDADDGFQAPRPPRPVRVDTES